MNSLGCEAIYLSQQLVENFEERDEVVEEGIHLVQREAVEEEYALYPLHHHTSCMYSPVAVRDDAP